MNNALSDVDCTCLPSSLTGLFVRRILFCIFKYIFMRRILLFEKCNSILKLRANRLTRLTGLTSLTRMEKLMCGENLFFQLPDDVENLTGLTDLDVMNIHSVFGFLFYLNFLFVVCCKSNHKDAGFASVDKLGRVVVAQEQAKSDCSWF